MTQVPSPVPCAPQAGQPVPTAVSTAPIELDPRALDTRRDVVVSTCGRARMTDSLDEHRLLPPEQERRIDNGLRELVDALIEAGWIEHDDSYGARRFYPGQARLLGLTQTQRWRSRDRRLPAGPAIELERRVRFERRRPNGLRDIIEALIRVEVVGVTETTDGRRFVAQAMGPDWVKIPLPRGAAPKASTRRRPQTTTGAG